MFTWVVGVPNGGTSCVAKIIDTLGVFMGDIPKKRAPFGRSYRAYEAKDFWPVINNHHPWMSTHRCPDVEAFAEACAEYARGRNKKQPMMEHGVKLWMNEALHSDVLFNGDHRFVFVDRPFERCISGFQRYNKLGLGQLDNFRMYCRHLEAGWITGLEKARELGVTSCWLPYNDLVKQPEIEIHRLVSELKLNPVKRQIEDAIKVVRNV